MAEWVKATEPIAYSIGLKPNEFEQVQPGEFWLLLEANVKRQQEQDYRTAYFLSYIIAPYLKNGETLDIEDIVAPLWGKADERKKQKQIEMKQRKEKDRAILEAEFGWALGSE